MILSLVRGRSSLSVLLMGERARCFLIKVGVRSLLSLLSCFSLRRTRFLLTCVLGGMLKRVVLLDLGAKRIFT